MLNFLKKIIGSQVQTSLSPEAQILMETIDGFSDSTKGCPGREVYAVLGMDPGCGSKMRQLTDLIQNSPNLQNWEKEALKAHVSLAVQKGWTTFKSPWNKKRAPKQHQKGSRTRAEAQGAMPQATEVAEDQGTF